jgi:lysophospholipase L1-like esterase
MDHSNNPYTYLALGDSYTIGESVSEEERWCVQLATKLRLNGYSINNPDIIAKTGWTTNELASAITASDNSNTYDIVSLLIGVNNQYRGQSLDAYRIEFSELLNTSIKFAGNNASHVFVLSIPDWGVTPFAASLDREKIAKEIDAFNNIAREECLKQKVLFVDITPASRRALTTPSFVASDDLHFSGSMYNLWAEAALPAVMKLIGIK